MAWLQIIIQSDLRARINTININNHVPVPACRHNHTQQHTGSTSIKDCLCNRGFYQNISNATNSSDEDPCAYPTGTADSPCVQCPKFAFTGMKFLPFFLCSLCDMRHAICVMRCVLYVHLLARNVSRSYCVRYAICVMRYVLCVVCHMFVYWQETFPVLMCSLSVGRCGFHVRLLVKNVSSSSCVRVYRGAIIGVLVLCFDGGCRLVQLCTCQRICMNVHLYVYVYVYTHTHIHGSHW